jgi:retron-type reverse transcriptase
MDGMTVGQLKPYLKEEWKRIREELLAGEYRPSPVLKVEIPKADGKGMRMLASRRW